MNKKTATLRSLWLYMKVYIALLTAIYCQAKVPNFQITLLIMIFIAGRQHSLYILNHDASHGSLFPLRRINKWVATVFSNLVMFHHPEAWSFIRWRRDHMKHHRYLFTEHDPDYVRRKACGDTKRKPTHFQLLWACIQSVIQTLLPFFRLDQKNHLFTLIYPFREDTALETERRIKLLFFVLSFIVLTYFNLWRSFFALLDITYVHVLPHDIKVS